VTDTTLKDATAGAVVIGGDYQGLSIARSLGRRGIPVFVLDDEPSIAKFSRYVKNSARVPSLRDEGAVISTLLTVGRQYNLGGFVLFATRDETVAALSRGRSELTDFFRVPTPEWESVRWAWDKRLTHQLALDLDIPSPETWWTSERSGPDVRQWRFPVIVKPAIKEHFIYTTKVKAWRADSPDTLVTTYDRACRIIPRDEVMVQELIPGGGDRQFSYCAFVKDGRPIASMVACRIRQRPLDFGRSSTYVRTVEVPLLEELSLRFLSAMDYYGLVELEYKFDVRDRRYKLLDVNPRTWGYHSLGQAAGVDFPYLLFSDQVDGRASNRRARPGVSWVRLTTDVPTAFSQIAHRELWPHDYLLTLLRTDTEAVFSRDDPLPWCAELALLPYLYRTRTSSDRRKSRP
jgi:predicted ATP-grasp superfamily ATP-dependent carboligase